MKHLLLATAIVSMASFASCKKENKTTDNPATPNVLGKWNLISAHADDYNERGERISGMTYPVQTGNYYEFKDNGTVTYQLGTNDLTTKTYTITGESITIGDKTGKIKSCNATEMVFTKETTDGRYKTVDTYTVKK